MAGKNDNGDAHSMSAAVEVALDNQRPFEPQSLTKPGDMRQIWQVALRDLQSQVDRHEYESWIKNLLLLDIKQGIALISTPNTYARRRLEGDFCEVICRVLSRVVGQTLAVQFTLESMEQGQMFDSAPALAMSAGRPAPKPGIRARGAYLDLVEPELNHPVGWATQAQNGFSSNGNGHSAYEQAKNGYYSNGSNGRNSNGFANGKAQPQSDSLSARQRNDNYRFAEERAEYNETMSAETLANMNQMTDEYEAVSLRYGLNPRYVFERYIVGSSNRMANAAGRSVAENPGNSYNPLFIYGGVGLGKTHLLHAIGHEALRLRPHLKVLYVTSEKFTNDLINGIREQRMEEFRSHYRSIDLLMIDDIQFIAGKEQTQEEFFHTFNSLVEANKQVIISSDRSPKSMLVLSDRLRSRFEGGLISDISLPDYEMRLAILRAKADYQPVPISNDVLEHIAHKVPTNIRELEGALVRVVAFSFLNKVPLTVELAAQALNDAMISSRKKLVTKERIVDAVGNFYSVDVKELQGKSRSADIVLPRQVAMYVMREQTDHSLVEIGQMLGGRDHTTVMHGLEKIENALETNTQLRQQINTIVQIVYNNDNLK